LESANDQLRRQRGEDSSVAAQLKVIEVEHQRIIENMKRFVTLIPPLPSPVPSPWSSPCSRESETKMVTFSKTIESLKSQCEHLTSLLREDDQQMTRSEEVKAMRKELEYAMERASKAERRKRELASELLAQRTKNETVIHELEGKVSQYEVSLRQGGGGGLSVDLIDTLCRRI
jgi:hypothetical protein